MRTISFSQNWNGKLDNEYFTTIRPENYDYPDSGKVKVEYPDDSMIEVKVIDRKDMKFKELTGWISRLDAGMSKKELYNLLEDFYSGKGFWQKTDTEVSVLLLKNLEVEN